MLTTTDRLFEHGCNTEKKERLCRSRGGESCAFDGAMIVLQPIADSAHVVHGPVACCGNSWEGRGTLSSRGDLHRMGFTTDVDEIDIVYGSEAKLLNAIAQTCRAVNPKAVFVYSTCVSGLIGEDLDSVCRRAEDACGVKVIPVNAPGFVGPKNLGNRIAGDVLLEHVIGTGEPPGGLLSAGGAFINLIGEYNIAGDLWLVEPLLREAGIGVMSRITGNATFEEITYAHRADLNVVVCSRALVNVAREMERKYGIPYIEVSFFGKTETSKALREIGGRLGRRETVEDVIGREEARVDERLRRLGDLRGKRAVLYTGGVKSWSFISALLDLGIEVVAVGTKKSTFEDEEKMKAILGDDAPLVEDVSAPNLKRLMREKRADILVAGGRNLYLAMKEGYPFVDVNQERHTAYAGYEGLINLAEDMSRSIRFFSGAAASGPVVVTKGVSCGSGRDVLVNPLKHSQSIGAAIALQGIDRALPVIHGAQGCTFLAKVLLTKHFREPIALMSSKLFTEDVVMGSEEALAAAVEAAAEKQGPDLIGILTSGLTEVKGDDVAGVVKGFETQCTGTAIVHIPTPDYEGGLESGYARAVERVLEALAGERSAGAPDVNVLAGSHLTPADFTELREMIEAFGLRPVMLPDLSALDGGRQGFSALASGGARIGDIERMGGASFTIAVGASMEGPARLLAERFGIEYAVFDSISSLQGVDALMETLSALSGRRMPARYERQRRVLVDGMRDAHFHLGGKRVCTALEPDLSVQVSGLLGEAGAEVGLAVVPAQAESLGRIRAGNVMVGDLFSIDGEFDMLIASSHGTDTAERLGVPLYQMGFPVHKVLGVNARVTVGYRGALTLINDIANLLL